MDCKPHFRAFPARSPTRMQSTYKERPGNQSEIKKILSNMVHVDFDIGPVRVVAALTRITGLSSCAPFCMLLQKKFSENI
jgi:hypothetical protein